MDIINFYYKKTRDIISQVNLTAQNYDYMNWLILESVKSIYLLSKDLVSKDQKGTFSCLKTIIKNNSATSANNSTLYSFVEAAKQEFKIFSGMRLDSQKKLDSLCEQLKKICVQTKENNNDTHYWDTPEYHNNIPDSQSAKEILISIYLFCILLFLYCTQSNSKLFSVLTTDLTNISKNSEDNIQILDEFYQNGRNQIIQFFLPIEADVTFSYFFYRYILDEGVSGELGRDWAMGNTGKKSVPTKINDIIHIIEPFRKNNSAKSTKNETFHSWINKLKEYGVFDTTEIDSVEKIKVLCLRQYVLATKWNGNDRAKSKLDLMDFIKKPNNTFFREFGSHIKTDANTVGTILASELMKELPIKDVCFWVEKCFGIEMGIKNIQNTLKNLCTNNCYTVPHRKVFIYELEYCHQYYKIEIENNTPNTSSEYSPILAVFLIYNLYKAKARLQNTITQFIFLNDHFDDLILSVYPKWDDNPQEQEENVIFDDLTGEKLSKILSNIDITLSSPRDGIKAAGRLADFFRLYFPAKYYIAQKCTQRECVSVYELLEDIKQSKLPNYIKKAFLATKVPHNEVGIVRELALAKIEMHHMASNYNTIFIPILLRVLNLFECPDNSEKTTTDKISLYSNALYEICNCSKHINFWVEQLCRYLFGRNIDGKYYSDFFPEGRSIDVDPDAKIIFNDFFIPFENIAIESICSKNGISREELSNIWYGEQK